ncbi:MAG: hypothetical protein JWR52_1094 [Marmoricola sp.]|nr:hypothetical protein [Marmoricola sp.]
MRSGLSLVELPLAPERFLNQDPASPNSLGAAQTLAYAHSRTSRLERFAGGPCIAMAILLRGATQHYNWESYFTLDRLLL